MQKLKNKGEIEKFNKKNGEFHRPMLQMQPHTAEIAEIRKLETIEGEESAFLRVIDKHIASSSMVEEIRWINLTRQQIAHLLYLGYVYINTCHDTSETD